MKKYILFVYKDMTTIHVIGNRLASKGYGIYISTNYDEALQYAKNYPVDMVVSNLCVNQVPGMVIIEAIRKIHPDTTTILMASNVNFSKNQCNKLGIDAFIKIPFTEKKLEKIIQKVFKKKEVSYEHKNFLFNGYCGSNALMQPNNIRRRGH